MSQENWREIISEFNPDNDVPSESSLEGWMRWSRVLNNSYGIPKKRAKVVALARYKRYYSDFTNETIAEILGVSQSTISEHLKKFTQNDLSSAKCRYNAFRPTGYSDSVDLDEWDTERWIPINTVQYECKNGITEINLFKEMLGNAVEPEYLLVIEETKTTEKVAETKTVKKRSPISGTSTLRARLLGNFSSPQSAVARYSILVASGIDPKRTFKDVYNGEFNEIDSLINEVKSKIDASYNIEEIFM